MHVESSPQVDPTPSTPATPDVDVAIIGSGFAGLGMAIQLEKAGRKSYAVFEKGSDVGGTWRDNTYPGCACDIPSHLYSFSFDLNPDWSRMYPTQPEIWEYLKRSAASHGVLPNVRFDSEVREVVFDEARSVWRVSTATGDSVTARVVVSGMGGLCRPAYPEIPGRESFEGPAFHSSDWDHSVELDGKRVAVIGTGASAIQIVPHLASQAGELALFQRSPPWVFPKLDRPIRRWERFLFRYLPGYMRSFRAWLYWRQEIVALGYTLKPGLLKSVAAWCRRHIAKTIPDPELAAKVTPDYQLGCKRTLLSNDYLPALAQSNVEVVTEGIAEIRPDRVVTVDGTERQVDAPVYATGFKTMDLLSPVRFVGKGGAALDEQWARSRPEAYYGVTVNGYPNLFFLIGPNSRTANNSIVFMIEAQIHYVLECLDHMDAIGVKTMEVVPEAQVEYNKALQERMARTVFVSGCNNWYRDAKGQNPILWPGFSFRYWMKARRVDPGAFQGVG